MEPTPERILMVGDLHGNWPWVLTRLLPHIDEVCPDLIVQVGDFGYWPHMVWGRKWIRLWTSALAERDLHLWWIDGNHEDFDSLLKRPIDERTGRRPLSERVHHLPRGHRWAWKGLEWVALGGAVSVDRWSRTAGSDWFPQEAVTEADVLRACEGGPAHVVVAHDSPWGAPRLGKRLQQDRPPEERDTWWPGDMLLRSDLNQQALRGVLDAVEPAVWFHGHHHTRIVDQIGSTRLEGLACDQNGVTDVTVIVGPDGRRLVEDWP